jgi:predicted phosphohydrolase
VLEKLAAAGVARAVYGHLHADDHLWAPRGPHGGVDLVFVAADHTGFSPVEVWDTGRA